MKIYDAHIGGRTGVHYGRVNNKVLKHLDIPTSFLLLIGSCEGCGGKQPMVARDVGRGESLVTFT